MIQPRFVAWFVLAFCGLVGACGSDSDANGGAAGTGTGGAGGQVCYNVTVNDKGTGTTTCATTECKPGEYCDGTFCFGGCKAFDNCPQGQYCDNSSGIPGTCHVPGPNNVIACGNAGSGGGVAGAAGSASCPDVHGVYTLSKDASSSQECPNVSGECTATQNGCSVSMPCGMFSFTTTLDANGQGTASISGGTCAISYSAGMSADCQGGGLVCKYSGSKK
jgi:hypothetical protein